MEADLERKKLGDSTSLEEGEEAAGTGECACACVCRGKCACVSLGVFLRERGNFRI